ncbi:MAG: tyrosine-type recombinase/integrase [Nitriliruptoraceae bacterium]
MKGSVSSYETKNGRRWRIRFDRPPGFNADTGEVERRQTTRRGFRTRREAEQALREALAAVDHQRHVEIRKDTLGAYLRGWVEGLAVRETTRAHYQQQIELRIIPLLGGLRLQDVTTEHLDGLYRHLERSGSTKGGPLAAKSVRHVHGTLHTALAAAVKRGHVTRNVAAHATPPRAPRKEMRVWSAEDLRAFVAHVRDDRLAAMWQLLATTGLRRGEALGLQWRDVDLDAATVFVHRNLTVANGRAMVNETKTAHGRRKIALDPATVTVLRRHRRHQLEEKLAADVAWEEHDLVFCGFDGRPIHPKQPTRWFREHIHVAGLPAIRLHDVRHTYASIAQIRRVASDSAFVGGGDAVLVVL